MGSLKGFTTSQYWKRSREILGTREVATLGAIPDADRGDREKLLAALMDWRATLRPECAKLKNWPKVRPQFFMSKKLWKPKLFDHIIRNEQDLRETIEYIVMNPVKRGYVSKPQFYPFYRIRIL
jgi:hypothetical protein